MKHLFISLIFSFLLTSLWACSAAEKNLTLTKTPRTAASVDCNQYNSSSKEWANCANANPQDHDSLSVLVKINEALEQCQNADYVQGSACDNFMSSIAKCGSSVDCKMRAYVLFK